MAKRNVTNPEDMNGNDRMAQALRENPTMSIDELFAKLLPGAKEHSSDIVGTWDSDDPTNPIVCIPESAVVGDGKKYDATKPSLLIFATLVHPCRVKVKGDEDDATEEAPAGARVGIWAKPGMSDMRDLCDCKILMVRDTSKDKDTGKGNDLKGYRVGSTEKGGKVIPITADRRDKSKGTRCFLDPLDYGKTPSAGTRVPVKGVPDDNIPF